MTNLDHLDWAARRLSDEGHCTEERAVLDARGEIVRLRAEAQNLRSRDARHDIENSLITAILDDEDTASFSDYETPLTERIRALLREQPELRKDKERMDWLERHRRIYLAQSHPTCMYETFPLSYGPGTPEREHEHIRDERACASYRGLIDLVTAHPQPS